MTIPAALSLEKWLNGSSANVGASLQTSFAQVCTTLGEDKVYVAANDVAKTLTSIWRRVPQEFGAVRPSPSQGA
jgi:hypothetical protein